MSAILDKFSLVRSCCVTIISSVFLACFAASACLAQPSNQPIRIAVGFGAGTSPDVILRILSKEIERKLGRAVIIENVTGASGNIAAQRVARAEPDGSTLLFTSVSSLVNAALYKSVPFDIAKDFSPISIVCTHPNLLVANKAIGARDISQFISLVRSRPGQFTMASAGTGTTQHLSAEMFRSMAGIDLPHVPYRGGQNLLQDLTTMQVSSTFAVPTSVMPLVQSGNLIALAVTSATRSRFTPDVPTMIEVGFPDFDLTVWWGLLAPAGTPSDVIHKLHMAVSAILDEPDMHKRFDDMFVEVRTSTPEEFAALIAADALKWSGIVKTLGLQPN